MNTHLKSIGALAAVELWTLATRAMAHPMAMMLLVLVVMLICSSPAFAHSSQG